MIPAGTTSAMTLKTPVRSSTSISKLKNSDDLWNDVIPIAFHVDYWNYLGWKDEMAEEIFSDRQRQCRREGSISQVYTPGFVVDGKEWRGFFKRKMLEPAEPVQVGEITLQINSGTISAKFIPQINIDETLVFHAAVLGFNIENNIQAGENAGKTLLHDFAVIAYDSKIVSHDNNTYATDMQMPQTEYSAERKAIVAWFRHLPNMIFRRTCPNAKPVSVCCPVRIGNVNYPFWAQHNEWVDSIRGHSRFDAIMRDVEREWLSVTSVS